MAASFDGDLEATGWSAAPWIQSVTPIEPGVLRIEIAASLNELYVLEFSSDLDTWIDPGLAKPATLSRASPRGSGQAALSQRTRSADMHLAGAWATRPQHCAGAVFFAEPGRSPRLASADLDVFHDTVAAVHEAAARATATLQAAG